MKIKILGSGCTKCNNLEKTVHDVLSELAIDAEVQKIGNIMQIMNYGVMQTPGLVINEELIFSGNVPPKERIKQLLLQHR